jgi:hypothetical protein
MSSKENPQRPNSKSPTNQQQQKKTWIFQEKVIRTKDFETEFEENRRCLLNSYSSNAQTHGTFIIAIAIAFLSLIPNWNNFAVSTLYVVVFCLLLIVTLVLGVIMILRIAYWTLLGSGAVTITLEDAISFFHKYNPKEKYPYYSKPPLMAVIQTAIIHNLAELSEKTAGGKRLSLYRRLAWRTARIKIEG